MKEVIRIKKITVAVILILIVSLPATYASNEVTCSFNASDPNYGSSAIMELPEPENKSWRDTDNHSMKVKVSNQLGETMDVSFYWHNNHTLIGEDTDVANDTYANVTVGFSYVEYENYTWYVNVTATHYDNQSAKWWFKGEAHNWDINRDEDINIVDVTGVTAHYGETDETPHWIRADCAENGDINIVDVTTVTSHYGESY